MDNERSSKGTLVSLTTLKTADGMDYNVGFVVSKYRKYGHLTSVVNQRDSSKNARLSKYGQSLFNSCFKNW